MDLTPSPPPRLYNDLVWLWPYVSPPEHYVAEVEAMRRVLHRYGVPDGSSVLHLGCGAGSIDANLQAYYRVTGVDRSAGMLQYAARVNPQGEYIPGDMRAADLGRTFDAVLSHDAISYQITREDLLASYRTAARHLQPGGVLIAFPEQVRAQFVQGRIDVSTSSDETRHVTVIEQQYDPDVSDTSYEKTFVYLVREGGGFQSYVDTHRIGIHPLEDFVAAVAAAGFDTTVERCELSDIEEYFVIIGRRN